MRFKWPTEKMSCVNSVAMKQNMRIPIHKQTNRATFTNKNEPIIYFIDDTSPFYIYDFGYLNGTFP